MTILRFGAAILALAALGTVLSACQGDHCIQGYVWREATPFDHVCVIPWMRSQVARDNSLAPQRWTNGPYGPQTCIQGYVWREAFPGDRVCVTPLMRRLVRQDNASAGSRVAPYICAMCNDNTCQCGYASSSYVLCSIHGGVNWRVGCVQQP